MADEDDQMLRQELHGGLQFVFNMQTAMRHDVHETAYTVMALLEELTESGMVEAGVMAERVKTRVASELKRIETHSHVQIREAEDKYALTDLPDIDCDTRIHLCQARCCSFHFALSRQDLDERVVQWDHYRPYLIKQRPEDKYCVHSDPVTRGCGVYHHRPAVCRIYDCREDKRIWEDFEKRIPAAPKKEPDVLL